MFSSTTTPKSLILYGLLAISFAGRCASSANEPASQWFSIASQLVHQQAFDGAHDVELSGSLAFVPGKGGALAIVDVANPENPKLLWFRHDAKELPDAETVLPVGKHLLLGTRDFLTLDMTDPRKPVVLGKVSDRTIVTAD